MENWIRQYSAFSDDLCASLRNLVDTTSVTINEGYRKCKQYFIPLENEVMLPLRDAIKAAFEEYKTDVLHNNHLSFTINIEQPSILKYETNGEDYFHLHSDNWNSKSACRQVAIVAYLSDCEEGGETVFPIQDEIIRPRQGNVLMFPAFFTHSHLARSPISEPKYVLVTWLCYVPDGQPYWTVSL